VIPGKKPTPEDILRALWRYRWVIVIPFVVIAAGTLVATRYIPDRYRADTLILVVPQRVPEAYVKSTVTTKIEDRLQSISQQILSRTRLERIIQDFNLYPVERRTGIMEDVVERMRKDIDVQLVKGDAFRVSYTGAEPRTVMKVTERLASLFIDESLRDREVLAEGTNQFLEAQLEDARRQLVEHEKKLEAFRRQYDGQLPSQVDSNMESIRTFEVQLQSLNESLNRDRDQKIMVERQIADTNITEPSVAQAASPGAPDAPAVGSAAQQLETAKNALAAMLLHLKPEHPDVVRMKRTIQELQAKADAEALEKPVSPSAQPATPQERARQNRLRDLHAQKDTLDRRIGEKEKEAAVLQKRVNDFQQRVAAAPTRESELTALTRDYSTLQKTYADLLSKKEESQIAANLERRQIGEQFKILDPARVPEKPASPNRPMLDGAGAAAGLALGLALAAFFEFRDTSIKSDADVAFALAIPVLASVPQMITTAERRRHRRRQILTGAATLVVCLLAAGALVFWKLRA
jgi:polysaccharide chain length determinant protein (PEP-CTERM system associated)